MQGIFKNNWKWFVSSLCLGLLREKGTTVQKFFPDVLKSVYSLRLKGEQHLEGYNFQRTMDELIEGLNEKEKEVEKEVEPAEKRRKLDENESDETRFVRELELSKHLSLGALQSMHKDGQSVYKTPIVQLIGKNIEGGQLRSVTFSDGWTIGHAVPTSSS